MLAVGLSSAGANPQGGTVRGGSATIGAPVGGRLDINQTSDRAIIDWRGFSIGAGEITRFNQPSATAATLNRVVGEDPSHILGQLSANGRVLLINPNGVLFGTGSRVDVAGLVATTANIANDDFMARRLAFTMPGRPGAAVVNRGTITVAAGGVVALVAPGVANEGVINARLGRVSLVSANRFTVDFHGDQLIQFALDDKVMQRAIAADGTSLAAAVSNSGRIAADGGVVQMSANAARGVLDRTIDMSGVIEARAVRQVGGRIVLDGGDGTVQVSGRLDATGRGAGQTGGTIKIIGERVGLFAGTNVDASGDAGGGTVLVGGNRQGQGPERNAQATYVDAQASIKADAVTQGDGGNVVVWSDNYTRFDGMISARGGAAGGNGGAVETSSRNVLDVATGRVDAAAPAGRAGTWLLDPYDITITNSTTNGSFSGGNPNVFTPTNTATVDAATISASLSGGTSVTIDTGAPGGDNGDITVAANITKSGGGLATLTIVAAGAMSVTGAPVIGVTAGNSLNVDITLGNAGTLPAMSLGTGSLTVNSSGGHLFSNGPITQTAGGGAVSFNMNTHGLDLADAGNLITGTLSIANGAGSNITIVNSGSLTLGTWSLNSTGSPISITAVGGITQTGPMTQPAGASSVTLNAGAGPITMTNAGNAITGTLSLTNSAANVVQVVNTVATKFGTSSIGRNLTFSTAGAITQSGAFTVAGTSSFATGASAITLTQAANSFTGAVSLSNSGANNVQLTNATATVLGTSTIGKALTVISGGTVTQTGVLTVGSSTTLSSTVGVADMLLNTQANDFAGGVGFGGTLTRIRDVALRNVNAAATVPVLGGLTNLRNLTLQFDNAGMALGAFTASGNVALTAAGAVTQTAAATVTGTTSVAAGANAIALTQAANSFTGAVALSNSGANDVTLTNNRATALAAATVGRNLSLTSNGAVTQTAAATVGGTTTVSAGANAITLSQAGNAFTGAMALSNSGANDATLTNNIATVLGAATIGRNLSVTSNGAITQTAAATVGGATTVSAGANAITLTQAGNALTGAVALSNSGANDATLTNNIATVLGTSAVGRNLTVTSNGAITQTGALTVGGTGSFAAGTNAVTLTQAANSFGGFAVTSGQTVATGTIAGVSGGAAATLATAPGSTGTQTFNGCTIGTGCVAAAAPPVVTVTSVVSVAEGVAVTSATNQVLGAATRQPAPSSDPNGSNVGGFEVSIPTQNVDWSNPSGDLNVTLAPELNILHPFFHGGQASR
ncbi:MAG: filamentous hemagglutinin N-terminal domain-containing protein [Proteobacteria bacterium]|nr:filamentous hemagglutinin N-terminal domain-containing protein [Pseudomonadota bacterium]